MTAVYKGPFDFSFFLSHFTSFAIFFNVKHKYKNNVYTALPLFSLV